MLVSKASLIRVSQTLTFDPLPCLLFFGLTVHKWVCNQPLKLKVEWVIAQKFTLKYKSTFVSKRIRENPAVLMSTR